MITFMMIIDMLCVCGQATAKTRHLSSNWLMKKTRTKRGNHCQWSEAAMLSAIQAVREQGMWQRAASEAFSIPRCILQVRLSGKTELDAKPGHPTKLSKEEKNLSILPATEQDWELVLGASSF